MVKVCSCCSNVNVEILKETVAESELQLGCIDQCQGFGGKSFGIVDGELLIADSSEEFIKKCSSKKE